MTDSTRTTVTTSLNKSGLDCKVARRTSPPATEAAKSEAWTWQKKREKTFWIVLREVRGRGVYSDEMVTELSAMKQSSLSGGNWAQLINRLIAPLLWSMVVAESCCGGAFWAEGTGWLLWMEETTNGTKWTHFLGELAFKSAKKHRRAATANVLTVKSALEQGRHWKFCIMTWAVTELQLPTENGENFEPEIVSVVEYSVRAQCWCKWKVFTPAGLSLGCVAHDLTISGLVRNSVWH